MLICHPIFMCNVALPILFIVQNVKNEGFRFVCVKNINFKILWFLYIFTYSSKMFYVCSSILVKERFLTKKKSGSSFFFKFEHFFFDTKCVSKQFRAKRILEGVKPFKSPLVAKLLVIIIKCKKKKFEAKLVIIMKTLQFCGGAATSNG